MFPTSGKSNTLSNNILPCFWLWWELVSRSSCGKARLNWLYPEEDDTAGDEPGVRVCSSSVLSLWLPSLCPLQYVKVVNDYLGTAMLNLLGGIKRKDGKKIIASAHVSGARYIEGENNDIRSSITPVACWCRCFTWPFYLSFISAGSPSIHCYQSCSCSPTSRQSWDVIPRPVVVTIISV